MYFSVAIQKSCFFFGKSAALGLSRQTSNFFFFLNSNLFHLLQFITKMSIVSQALEIKLSEKTYILGNKGTQPVTQFRLLTRLQTNNIFAYFHIETASYQASDSAVSGTCVRRRETKETRVRNKELISTRAVTMTRVCLMEKGNVEHCS